MSLLDTSNLSCWLVSSAAICSIGLLTKFIPLLMTCLYFMISWDIIGIVDEVVFSHVGSKSTRIVFKVNDLRLCCAIDLLTNYGFLNYYMSLLSSLFVSYSVQLLFVFDDYKLMHWPLFICCSGQILSCTLWDIYCLQFLEYLNEAENDVPIIIILTHGQ